jgi:hypothetical protein
MWRLAAALALVASVAAQAQPALPELCLPEDQYKARLVLRLHTQLMVVSLLCPGEYRDRTLYQQYRAFTRNNANLLIRSQALMIEVLRDAAALDSWWTELANAESLKAAQLSTPAYCAARRQLFRDLMGRPAAEVERRVADLAQAGRREACSPRWEETAAPSSFDSKAPGIL